MEEELNVRKKVVEPDQCNNCQEPGHHAGVCKKAMCCSKCGGEGHNFRSCRNTARNTYECRNCGGKGHGPRDDERCPWYIEEIRRLGEQFPCNNRRLFATEDPATHLTYKDEYLIEIEEKRRAEEGEAGGENGGGTEAETQAFDDDQPFGNGTGTGSWGDEELNLDNDMWGKKKDALRQTTLMETMRGRTGEMRSQEYRSKDQTTTPFYAFNQ
ncbi:hypothetical protein BJ165DRAFT_1522112 [Panaeolus papilionaceus]|nr:hypothetical protein BJ165DRAFT_1522112 [Panaeolus papilionaceus]